MGQPGIARNAIQIISRHKKLSASETKHLLRDNGVYADKPDWAKFIDLSLLSLGTAFLVAGVIFFFAYNWDDRHKFAKLGIVQALVIGGISAIFLLKRNLLVKNILLTGTSVLVGLLFSVFGQIYQTGADAYDFFLGWTVFVLIWALVSNFAPLWLFLLLLINVTFNLYIDQAGPDLTVTTTYLVLFLINTAAIVLVKIVSLRNKNIQAPDWFIKIVALAAACCITLSLISGIFSHYPSEWVLALVITMVVYGCSVKYALRQRSLFLLCIVPLSCIVVVAALLFELLSYENAATYLLIGLFIIFSITLLIYDLIKLNRKWHGYSE